MAGWADGLTPWVGGAILVAAVGAALGLLVRELARATAAAGGGPGGPDELADLIAEVLEKDYELTLETTTDRAFVGTPEGYDGRWVRLLVGDGRVVLVDAESVVAAYVGDDPGTRIGD